MFIETVHTPTLSSHSGCLAAVQTPAPADGESLEKVPTNSAGIDCISCRPATAIDKWDSSRVRHVCDSSQFWLSNCSLWAKVSWGRERSKRREILNGAINYSIFTLQNRWGPGLCTRWARRWEFVCTVSRWGCCDAQESSFRWWVGKIAISFSLENGKSFHSLPSELFSFSAMLACSNQQGTSPDLLLSNDVQEWRLREDSNLRHRRELQQEQRRAEHYLCELLNNRTRAAQLYRRSVPARHHREAWANRLSEKWNIDWLLIAQCQHRRGQVQRENRHRSIESWRGSADNGQTWTQAKDEERSEGDDTASRQQQQFERKSLRSSRTRERDVKAPAKEQQRCRLHQQHARTAAARDKQR